MSEILRRRDHQCSSVLTRWPHHGEIRRCECGQAWRGVEPGNPAYAGWRPVGSLELRVRLWFAERNTRRHS